MTPFVVHSRSVRLMVVASVTGVAALVLAVAVSFSGLFL